VDGQARGEHCRRCGERTERRIPAGDNLPRAICPGCGAIEYDNPKVVVACALFEGEQILWPRRTLAPYAGRWALPAGFVELGETLAEAACRELHEETQLRIAPDRLSLYGVLSLPDVEQIYVALAAPLPTHDYGPTAEASEVRMFTREQIVSLHLGYPDPTLELVLGLYDALLAGELHRAPGRVFDIRGTDPGAVLNS
jgi:ADP-ribose pyrophosphatase YjhB (NUDIX family)